MKHYRVYGSCLASTIDFPELVPVDDLSLASSSPERGCAAPTWRFATVDTLRPMRDATELGSERIYADVHARLFAHREGHRVVVDDTGAFDLSHDRRDVVCERRGESWPEFVRAHCIGRVLSTALYLDGWLPLHGSAVEVHDGVIGFLAPKGFGKSALALALLDAGARLVTDDTLPVEMSTPPRAWPGVHSIRVRADTGATPPATAPDSHDGKITLSGMSQSLLMTRPAPLRALYLLEPVMDGTAEPAVRLAITETIAAVGVVAHVKIGRMLGPSAGPVMLTRAAHIVREVPVYRLEVARNMMRLPSVAERIVSWHSTPT